ncbi:MAG: hypothetical protein VKJ25_05195 [Okeania sp.]|nr:hypothetical protein [Okeania sp.]
MSVIVLEKLPQMIRKELKTMFSMNDLKKTRLAQELIAGIKIETKSEAKLEAKLEVIPKLLKKGFSVQKIAEI